jgi:phosphate/sulfate permease
METALIIFVLLIGFYMAWNIGANDVANAMGTSVGSRALTLKQAVIVAAILEFSGAFLMGSHVSETMQSGLIDLEFFRSSPDQLILGMLSALLATSIWLQIASYFGWPVSTTHAIVGSIIGFGIVARGFGAVYWKEVGIIASSWVLSPVLSGLVSFAIFKLVQKKVLFSFSPVYAAKKLAPYIVFIVITTFCIGTSFDALSNLNIKIHPGFVIMGALAIGLLAMLITYILLKKAQISKLMPSSGVIRGVAQISSMHRAIRHLEKVRATASGEVHNMVGNCVSSMQSIVQKIKKKIDAKPVLSSDFREVEGVFSYLQIISACFVAFAHGANDVANAIGPVASVIQIIRNPSSFSTTAEISPALLALGGIGIVIGLATWGWRVIETIGTRITELTPSRGFCAEFGAAATILVASKMGLPISTTHCIVGAVLGIGFAKGISAINLRMVRDIVLSWIITIPSSAITSIALYYALKSLLGSLSLI